MEPIRVLLVDDHPVVRQGLRSMLETNPDIRVVGEASDGLEGLRLAKRLGVDVALVDIRMPLLNGIQLTRELRGQLPQVKVLVLTTYEQDEYLFGALQEGASGYLLKNSSFEEIVGAIRRVHRGERLLSSDLVGRVLDRMESISRDSLLRELGLSEEEVRLLGCVARGQTNREIGDALGYSEVAIKRRLHAIFDKLGARDRAQAVAEAFRRGLL